MSIGLGEIQRQSSAMFAICNAERKYLQRTIRYRVLCFFLFAVGVGSFLLCALVHGRYSSIDPNAGVIGVQYILPFVGAWILLISMVGSLFLCFDRHRRYQKARYEEVLYSRPFKNLQFVFGAVCATVVALWIPVIFTIATCFVLGLVLQWTDQVFYGMLEPWSLIGWLCITFPVACFFWTAIFVLLSSWLRFSMLVFCLGGLLIALEFVTAAFMPVNYVAFTTSGFNSVFFPSTTLPSLMTLGELHHKVALVLIGVAAICLASTLHIRRDQIRTGLTFTAGVVASLLAALSTFWLVQGVFEIQDERERWRDHHESNRDKPRGDIKSINGTVHIDPGVSLQLDLSVQVSTRQLDHQRELFFTLNPGFTIDDLTVDNKPVEFEFSDGLLVLNLPGSLNTEDSFVLTIAAKGLPNPNFAYLDASIDVDSAIGMDNSLAEFGREAALFEQDYVALMHGVRWLPSAGSYFAPSSSPYGIRDFFTLDLSVEAPARFEVVGPGTSNIQSNDGEWEITQFSPNAQISEVALLASAFHRFSMEVEGLKAELLLHPYHLRTVDNMASIGDSLKREFEDFVFLLRDANLDYDLGTLSFVEVPIQLRTIGGQWDMASVQALPGIIMLREHLLLKSDFGKSIPEFIPHITRDFDPLGATPFEDPRLARLVNYFIHDFMGGSVFAGISKNLTILRKNTSGPGGSALEHFMGVLFADTFFKGIHKPYYGLYAFTRPGDFDHFLWPPVLTRSLEQGLLHLNYRTNTLNTQLIQLRRSLDGNVISAAEGEPIITRHLEENAELNQKLIDMRAHYASKAIFDTYQHADLRSLIGRIVRDFAGRDFEVADLVRVANEEGFEDTFLFSQWLTHSSLAGYAVSIPKVSRLPDLEDGTFQYSFSMHIRNLESSPGIFSVFTMPPLDQPPVIIEGQTSLEINAVMPNPPGFVEIHPYMARNRFRIIHTNFYSLTSIMEVDENAQREPFVQESGWLPTTPQGIHVDDLDVGFSVVEPDDLEITWLKSLRERRLVPVETDKGLAKGSVTKWGYLTQPDRWYRSEGFNAWGNDYRRTLVMYFGTSSKVKATFETALPRDGQWNVDYYLSKDWVYSLQSGRPELQFTVKTKDLSQDIHLVLDGSNHGWLRVGSFKLPAGPVAVAIKAVEKEGRSFILADAIRWLEASQVPAE